MSEKYLVPPSTIRQWCLSDVMLMQRFFNEQHAKREQKNATDSPELMQQKFG